MLLTWTIPHTNAIRVPNIPGRMLMGEVAETTKALRLSLMCSRQEGVSTAEGVTPKYRQMPKHRHSGLTDSGIQRAHQA
jgi:hypothetical protein